MIDKASMGRRMTPRVLCDYVEGVRDEVPRYDREKCMECKERAEHACEDCEENKAYKGYKYALLKKGLYKEFFDELVPLSRFALCVYPPNYQVEWIAGNQGFDAAVYNESGGFVEHLEITTPHNGREEALDRVRVVKEGYGACYVGEPGSDLSALESDILETCREKARKDYSDCSLVVVIEPLSPFEGFEDDYEVRLEKIVAQMQQITYQANRVYLLLMPDRIVHIC